MRAFHRLPIRSGSRKLRLRSFSVPEEDRMNIHNNAPDADWSRANRHAGGKRTDAAGRRTSRRRLSAHRPQMGGALCRRRRRRFAGPVLAAEAALSPHPASRHEDTVAVEAATPVRRYERAHPGELIHLDIKKLGRFKRIGHRITGDRKGQSNARGVGWEFVHVCIDDTSRIALTRIMPDEKAASAVAFLKADVAYYKSLGVSVARVMTDNGSCYKSLAFARACRRLKIKHIRTKPYTPKTNGKAERFIQTALREWAYARAYQTSDQRAAELPIWTHHYNWHRPHGSLKSNPPISRLGLSDDNLLRLHS